MNFRTMLKSVLFLVALASMLPSANAQNSPTGPCNSGGECPIIIVGCPDPVTGLDGPCPEPPPNQNQCPTNTPPAPCSPEA